MAITASMVKELRERTGAGMMECKKALVTTDGNLEAAIEHLRKTGLAKADKKASRVAAEGIISHAQSADGKTSVLVEINSETDFVAKDASFLEFVAKAAEGALASGATDADSALASPIDGTDVNTLRQALIAKIGENIQIRRVERVSMDAGVVGSYIHGGRIGVMVELEGGDQELAKDIAMHVAAINPKFVDDTQVPAEELEKEKAILVAQAKDSGKPDNIIEKMVEGRLRKFLAEITLVGQPFVKDSDVTVAQLLKTNNAKVLAFHRIVVGEGIEKKEENFADEVMAQIKSS